MKCELKYMAHENIKLIKYITLRKMLVVVPIATITYLLFKSWLGINGAAFVIIGLLLVSLVMSFQEAVAYCKNR